MLEEYTMEEPKQQGRSPDSLIQAIDRIERLEKQLKIAVEALEAIKIGSLRENNGNYVFGLLEAVSYKMKVDLAQQALKQIKEFENERK